MKIEERIKNISSMEEYHELNQLVDDFDEEISTAPQKRVDE